MAWRNIRLNTNWPTAGQCDITDFSILTMNSWPSDKSPYIQYPSSTYDDFHNGTFFGDTTNYANGVIQSGRSCVLQIYMNGSYLTSYGNEFLTNDYTWGYVAAVDDENQKGFFALTIRYQNNTSLGWWAGSVPPLPNNSLRNTYYTLLTGNELEVTVTAPGGGATHIAKVTGHLSALSNNLSDILIVAGGGGGGMIVDSVAYDGADAGGISGNGTNSANQTTGYAFGQGESGSGVSGGGGGLYGGYKGVGGSSPSPVPPEYQSYIDALNGEGFFFKDWESGDYTDQYFQSISTTNFSQYSYVCYGTSNNIEEGIANYYNSGYDNYYKKYCSGHICTDAKVYIVSSGSVSYPYSYTATFTISNTTNTGYWGVQNDDINIYIYNNTNYINGGAQTDRHGQTFTYQSGSFQTLADALANVVCCNRNIDLYVDGVQWASACRT